MNLKTKNQMTVDQNQSKQHSPATWVPTLYFAMGMPFVVLNMVCTLMYKGMGVSDAQITFWTSLIMLPWTFKPLWSPFLEIYKTKKFFVIPSAAKKSTNEPTNSLIKPLTEAAKRESFVPWSILEIVEKVPKMLFGFSVFK